MPDSAGPNPAFRGGFCAWSRFVSTRCRALRRRVARSFIGRRRDHENAYRSACGTRDAVVAYFEMASSAMPLVRGPIKPIAAITITIAPAMNANTPNVPKPFSTPAITNDEKIAEKRLHE